MENPPTPLKNFMDTLAATTTTSHHGPKWLEAINSHYRENYGSFWDETLEGFMDSCVLHFLYTLCSPDSRVGAKIKEKTDCHISDKDLQTLQREIVELAELLGMKIIPEEINDEILISRYLPIILGLTQENEDRGG